MEFDDPRLALFRDFMRLWVKHGPEAFSDLLKILKSGQAVEDMIRVLESFQASPKPKKKAARKRVTKKKASRKQTAKKKTASRKSPESTSDLERWSNIIMKADSAKRD